MNADTKGISYQAIPPEIQQFIAVVTNELLSVICSSMKAGSRAKRRCCSAEKLDHGKNERVDVLRPVVLA